MNALLRRASRSTVLLLVAALAVAAVAYLRLTDRTTVTAYFTTSTGLYVGDEVRVLGVKVGEVTDVSPAPAKVRVELSLEHGTRVPMGAKAAIVSPSLVSGRFVQLAPAYTGGPALADGATIPLGDTAVPVSFDEVKKELTDLATALGPREGSSPNGPLNEAIRTLQANLAAGNDTQLRQTVSSLRGATEALSNGRSNLFETVSNLNSFTRNLVRYDAAVAGFTGQLTTASDVLADNRVLLAQAVRDLRTTLPELASFARKNRKPLAISVRQLNELTGSLADQSNTIASLLHVAPHSVAGLYNAFENQALTGRVTLANLDSTAELLCGALLGAGGTSNDCRTALGPLLDLLGLTSVPKAAGQPEVPAPPAGPSAAPPLLPTLPTVPLIGSLDLNNLLGLLNLNGGTQ